MTIERIIANARYVTATPITQIGKRICEFFNFKEIAKKKTPHAIYSIYGLKFDESAMKDMLRRYELEWSSEKSN